MKSNRFELRETAGGALLAGGGIGHGVGLCQRGAARRALAGETWEQILAHYFPDAAPAR